MSSFLSRLFGRTEKKSVIAVDELSETTREGAIHKEYIPKFLYKPPYGYPRYVNIPYIRWLAKTPYVDMCINTILDEIASIEWNITVNEKSKQKYLDEEGNLVERKQKEIEHIENFLKNPNSNYETFEDVFVRKALRDVLEINSGIIVKIFNLKENLLELVAADGGSFTKNPDIHGMFSSRKDIILQKEIVSKEKDIINPFLQISSMRVREEAAYFQYGWLTGPMPIPFGKREILWLERNPRTDDLYGVSPVQVLAKALQALLYSIDSELDYYNQNNVPKGIIGLEGSDTDEIEAFKQQWKEIQLTKDDFGNLRKLIHKVPIVNKVPKFERIQFSSQEMEVIEKQKWYSKMVWASFGITPTELGYTEDARGISNQIVQSKVFRKKAIYPLLRLLENKINNLIIPEFGYEDLVFKFNTFDIDEERNKYELYKLQTESGLRTINEIRHAEGLESVDWGDKPPRSWKSSENSFNIGLRPFQEQQEESEKLPKTHKTEEEQKALETNNNPLILSENELMATNPKRLEKALKYLLKQSEKTILDLVEKEVGKNTLKEIKSLDTIIQRLKSLINLVAVKDLVYRIIKNNFVKGVGDVEQELNRNFIPNPKAIEFIADYTFDNIKGLQDELVDDLRQELQRAIMDGEGISKIKERVKKVFDVGENRVEMIARTETNRAENHGRLFAYKESGVKGKKKWIAHIDDRTSDLCKRLDGQIVDLNENFKDPKGEWEGQAPPAHVNCRSKWVFVPDEDLE